MILIFFNKKIKLNYKKFCAKSIQTIKNRNQTEQLTMQEWKSIFAEEKKTKLSDLDRLYQKIAKKK